MFMKHTPTPEIYTLPYTTLFRSEFLKDPGIKIFTGVRITTAPDGELPRGPGEATETGTGDGRIMAEDALLQIDRKSTRLNSSHVKISYAVFCLKKKKTRNSCPTT